jgi:hypothetical protein
MLIFSLKNDIAFMTIILSTEKGFFFMFKQILQSAIIKLKNWKYNIRYNFITQYFGS